MSKIFVTQENPLFDYSSLDSFGDVRFVTLNDFTAAPNSLYNIDLMNSIESAMSGFDPDKDFLAPSGSPLITAACVAYLVKRGVTRIVVLRWTNRDRNYQQITLDFGGKYVL